MGVSMSTLIGWVAVLGVFGGYSFREWHKNRQLQLARVEAQQKRQERQTLALKKEAKETKSQPAKTKKPASKPAAKPAAPPAAAAAATAPPQRTTNYSYSSDDDNDAARNREFARQLASVKQGTKFTTKTKDESRQKSVKQSRAEELPTNGEAGRVSVPSSTAGIDADDDRSSAASPVLAAVEAGSVSDMLEKPAPGPSVLRLTDTEDKKASGKAKTTKPQEPAETKKQRQNRKKAEQAKEAREEAEKDRKNKLEAQRRLARQAEGRAAKDGSAFMAAQAKSSSVWTGSEVNGNGAAKAAGAVTTSDTNGFIPAQPLDIGDTNALKASVSKATTQSASKSDDWMSSLPSEEEQIKLLQEDDEWSTVKTKTKAKKAKTKEVVGAQGTPAATPAAAPAPAPTSFQNKPTKAIAQQSAFAALSTETVEGEDGEWDV